MRLAAVQLEAEIGNVETNLRLSEALADEAGRAGAEVIALPEFFTTGVAYKPELADAAVPFDGPATELLVALAARHNALVGGSFLCRDRDGHVRNAFVLAGRDGVIGRHDKDLPTMWENALYVGGGDRGVIETGDLAVGAALCWEFMRSATAQRLRGRVDLVVGGSGWWSIPTTWRPGPLWRAMERRNAATATSAPAAFGRYVGAPVVHAAHVGELMCPMPLMPLTYRGHFEGGASISAADGTILASRRREEGPGVVIADVEVGRSRPEAEVPDRFWLHPRGAMAALSWAYQNPHGRRIYARRTTGPVAAHGMRQV
jgi:predicted amidohydrolase